AVDQQPRIRRMGNRSFDDGRVAAQASTVLDAQCLSVSDEHAIDVLERLRAHELDVALQRRPLRWFLREADQAERAIALRVSEMQRELLVAEPIRLLNDQRAKNLLTAHAVTTAICSYAADKQISLDPPRKLRMRVEDRTHRLEFSNVVVTERSWNER